MDRGMGWRQAAVGWANLGFDAVAIAAALLGVAALAGSPLPIWGAALAIAVWSFGASLLRYYDPWANRGWIDELALIALMVGGAMTVLAISSWLTRAPTLPLGDAFLWAVAGIFAARRLLFRRLELGDQPLEEVLIVGTGAMGRSTAEELQLRRRARLEVKGFLAWPGDPKQGALAGAPVLGGSDELERILRSCPVHEVYIAGEPVRQGQAMQAAVRECERFGVPFALPAIPVRLDRAWPSQPGLVSDGYLHFLNHEARPYQRALKRLFDIVASAAALVVLSPLLLTVAALIKLTSKGPVFFKQERVGLHGRPFHMLKFRTMVVNADAMKEQLAALNEQQGPVFKIRNDPRVTPIGRLLRKHSIDELPQLLNVLRGEMSVVGPRPPVPKEVVQYEAWQRRRLSVRPGLTCIWQVSGRNEISFDDWMYLDMRYIDHWSFAEDLGLILKTVPVVLTGKGAS